jgi:uncharacterized protein YecT (DUF1311 family)
MSRRLSFMHALRFGALALALQVAGPGMPLAHAEVAPPDPLDLAMRQCLARDDRSSTSGQIQCMTEARSAWQGALQADYQRLLMISPASARHDWQLSQSRWLGWRNEEQQLERSVYATTQGSAYAMAQADMLLQSVRFRALALRDALAHAGPPTPAPAPAVTGNKVALTLPRACNDDATCEHAMFDLNRYYTKLRDRLPEWMRPQLQRTQNSWLAFRDASLPLLSESERVDLIGSRVATLKRLSETVGGR